MRVSAKGPGFILRDYAPAREHGGIAYAFPLDRAHETLGVGRALVPHALDLLRENGDLLLPNESDRPDRLTVPIRFADGANRRMIVMLGYRERLQCERRVRALRYDEAQARRAAFDALA